MEEEASQAPGQGQVEMSFSEGVNTIINILGVIIRRIEDDLAGNENVQEIANLIENIGGEMGRIKELLGEAEKEEASPPSE